MEQQKCIVYAIKRAMETVIDRDQCIAKLVALESDGAAAMLGKNNGIITLLQAQQPSMIAVHCSSHSLELAYKESIKKFPLAEKSCHITDRSFLHVQKQCIE